MTDQTDHADFLSMHGAPLSVTPNEPKAKDWRAPQNITLKMSDTAARKRVTALYHTTISTPYGLMWCAFDDVGLVYTGFQTGDKSSWSRAMGMALKLFPNADMLTSNAHGKMIADWIENPQSAPLTLHIFGTTFQQKVWRELLKIPSGMTTSYGTVASRIGASAAVRAVGTAVGSNPVSLIVPCHRVLHQGNKNAAYGWGVARKSIILAIEQGRFVQMTENAKTRRAA